MKHQQILDKLADRFLVQAMDENFAKAINWAMLGKEFTAEAQQKVWRQIQNRWNCVFDAPKSEVSDLYKHKTIVAMAVVAHKYGMSMEAICQKAFEAMDKLNKAVALSDDFERKTPEIKKFLQTPPEPLKRRPALPENITFFRAEDVISIQYKGKFYVAYIHNITGVNESAIIEFYDAVFDSLPTFEMLENIPARGRGCSDGSTRIQKYCVVQMKFLPDPANQVKLIASAIKTPPKNDHLSKSIGEYMMSSIFELQQEIEWTFPEK